MIDDRSTLTASGIAKLAGVGRAAVSNWRRRYADFPAPVGGTPASPSFNAYEVEQWLHRQGKLHQASTEQLAWRHIESYQPAAQIGDALGIAGAYLLAGPATGGLVTPKQLAARLRAIDPDLAALTGRILPARWSPHLTTLLQAVDTLAREQDPEAAFEYLHQRYVTSAQSMSGLATTADTVAAVMLGIAGRGERILDFTCGTGSILRIAADQALTTQCLGQEIRPDYALIALIRLRFVHRRAEHAPPPILQVGDSLLADAYPDTRADVVVANFPFGIHDWGHDRLAYDPRWVYGMPPRTEAELAWVQHALAHLSPGGTAVVLMPPAAALRPAGRRIRAELVRRGALRAVVALPAGLMPPAGIGLHIWVLVQPDEHQPATDRLLFIDAAGTGQPLADLVTTAWHDHRTGRHTDMPGVHIAVPAIAVLNDQVDLTPQRYLPPQPEQAVDPDRTMAGIDELGRLLTRIQTLLPAVQRTTSAALRTAPQANLADLVRAGSMTILRPAPRGRPNEPVVENAALTATDVASGTGPTGPGEHDRADLDRVQIGDILIPVLSREIIARVATPEQIGAQLGPSVQALRIDPALFDPWFVAGLLARGDNLRVTTRTSSLSGGSLRVDLKRLTIAVLSIQEQQTYGQAFQRLAELRGKLEQAAATGAVLTREIGEALAAGILTVVDNHTSTTRRPKRTSTT
ncbi:N-6 DNA methylase [Dactylosporangium sp. CA-233914]|uniref:N-6 DNA methylase n=1 Tax=Dactylosporangium sp. CA-233914 TaxID=3239934 RepID=UPI003D8E99F0